MVAEAEVSRQQSCPVVPYFSSATASAHVRELVTATNIEVSAARHVEVKSAHTVTVELPESPKQDFVPSVRSGSCADIGARRNMEDEHIQIDDLSMHLGPPFQFPQPSSFHGVFDGHGGPDAAAYIKENIIKLLFEDSSFPSSSEVDEDFLAELVNSIQRAYLQADRALADDGGVSRCTGTTALTAFIFGRLLVVANAGDCRAVLCRKGSAINMSQDHRGTNPRERKRVEEVGAYVEDGYLYGVLSVTRALGDWDVKLQSSKGGPSPLISEPDFQQLVLTEDDEFLILACDGVWDVMPSHRAVSIVRRGLKRHDNPEQAARDLVKESLRMGAQDNLTVVVVSLLDSERRALLSPPTRQRKLKFFSLSSDVLCSFKSFRDGGGSQ